MRKKIVVGILIILVIGIICGIILTKNIRLVFKLEKLAKQQEELNNYSYTMYNLNSKDKYKSISKYWVKGSKYAANIVTDNVLTTQVYEDNENQLYLMKRNDGTVYYWINGKTNAKSGIKCVPVDFIKHCDIHYYDMKENVKQISEEKFMDKDCYCIKTNEDKYWVEKDTGFVIGWTSGNNITSIKYERNNVNDNDIKKPDFTGYVN